MKATIFTNWTFYRFIRMIIGIAVLVQAFLSKDTLFGLAGLLFVAMAVFNVSCCGAGGCAASPQKKDRNLKDITYEEVG